MKKIYIYIITLVILNSVIYHRWLSFSVFTYSDWLFYFKETLADQLTPSVWNPTANFGFGDVDIILWKLPVYIANGLFGKFGFDYNVAEKFIVFWPIIFGLSLSSFLLVRYITKSNAGAFIGSLSFSFSTYFLSINSQGHQFLPASFVFSVFAILVYLKLIEERRMYLSIVSGITLFLVGAYDLRSLYITLGVIMFYFIYYICTSYNEIKKTLTRFLIHSLLPLLILFLLSFYWVLPLLFSNYYGENTVLGRQLFGNEVYKLQGAITTFFPFWTGSDTNWFTAHEIPLMFWLYPIIAILGLIAGRKNFKILFFALISLLGIFLSKQADIPFTQLYGWLYSHLPGFNAFREASKFNFLIALGYSVMIGSLFQWMFTKKIKGTTSYGRYSIYILFLFIILWNAKPIFTGNIRQLYVSRLIPKEYSELKDFIIKQPNYFRTFWINMNTHWIIYNNQHPELDGAIILNKDWSQLTLEENQNRKEAEGAKLMRRLDSDVTNDLLDHSSVKYVIVPLFDNETGHDITKGFGESYGFYKKSLEQIKYLKKVSKSSENILIYENYNYRPHLYITHKEEKLNENIPFYPIEYSANSPSQYQLNLKNLKGPVWLSFTDKYHPDWKIRVGEFNWLNALQDSNYFLPANLGKRNYIGYNSFYLNPEDICKEYQCVENSDGSYNLRLELYFKSQSNMFIGIFVSAITFIFAMVYLIYYGSKKIIKRKK